MLIENKLIFAVDFDGTLCTNSFPKIGEQTDQHKKLLDILIQLQKQGHKLILWTNRGDNENYKCLSEAIEWCKFQGLSFDAINKNLPEVEQKKLSGYSPKIMADYYIDDKALQFDQQNITSTLRILNSIKENDDEQT